MGLRSNNKLGINCGKTDTNEWTCKFKDPDNEEKATVKWRGSRDGDLELMGKDIDADVADKEDEILERSKKGVAVKSNKTASKGGGGDPFKGPSE